ncbi:MAG: hypothetical protein ACK4FJ_03580 [Ferrovibrio sp.]|uniref:hypothetical protein n=1 Tax=Ferrovibrio sp. TaxID=1917215 RepID=UPI00391C31ED
MARKRVILHGYLADLYRGPLPEFEAESAAEAIYAFTMQTKALNPKPGQQRHCVRVVGFEDPGLLFHPTEVEDIHLVPDFSGGGGGNGGFFKIVLGAVLVVAAFASAGGSLAAMVKAGALSGTGLLTSLGMSLMLGGVMELISPAPKRDTGGIGPQADVPASRYLGAPKNTVKIGTRIILAYGRNQVYGHFLSFDINAKQIPT